MTLRFEETLKRKLSEKSGGSISEETVLMRNFKYFDLDGSGAVSLAEFKKVMEKIGISFKSEEEIPALFV